MLALLLSQGVLVPACAAGAVAAFAADAAAAADDVRSGASVPVDDSTEAATVLGGVVVTGSRIVRMDYAGSSPLTTVSKEVIDSTGRVTVEDVLNALPQLGLGASKANAGWGGTGQATLNLRGLGAQRNLVLLDGRRLQPSTTDNIVDVNAIPTALIAGIEIISGGASAVYGSDAIAGVVNVLLNDRFEGIQLDTRHARYAEGDGDTHDVALTMGGHFASERGNAVLSFSGAEREGVDFMAREFFRRHPGGTDFRIQTGTYEFGANLPTQEALDLVFGQYGAAPGRVPVTPTTYLGFNDDGSLFLANNGPFNWRGPEGQLHDTGTQLNNLNQFSLIQVPLERKTAFGRVRYDISDRIEGYAQFSWADLHSYVAAEAGNTGINVPLTNPFIPADLRTILASRSNPDAPFRLHKRFQEAGPRTFERDFDIWQFLAGVKGHVDAIDGSWDVYLSRGSTSAHEVNNGAVVIDSLRTLLDAADGGASLCEGGYNPFGLSVLSDECRRYLVAATVSDTRFEQDVAEANLQGQLFALPAGEVRFAAGLGWRRNHYAFRPDRLLQQGGIVGVPAKGPSRGSTRVREAYVETLLPLLYDQPFAHALDLGLAWRHSDYDPSGGVDTFKIDFSWSPVSSLRVRGGYQRAVRAPSVGELYVAAETESNGYGLVANGQGDQCDASSPLRNGPNAAAVEALCIAHGVPAELLPTYVDTQRESLATRAGNTGLAPESADTYTVGVVWSPETIDLSLAVDYYDIRVEDVIGTLTATQVLASCFNQDGSNPTFAVDNFHCGLIRRNPETGRIDNIDKPTFNMGSLETSGIDVQVDWRRAIGDGELALGTVLGWVDRYEVRTTKGGKAYDHAGYVGTLPTWKAVSHLRHARGRGSLGLRWRYIGSMEHSSKVLNPASTAPPVDAHSYYDLFGRWRFGEHLVLDAGINNLFDKAPPQVGNTPGTTHNVTYDIYGRQYFVGLSVKL
ncbi:MAG TPA: TonB-dependent receptor [Dokdonella sp.]|uniref:TonB-dependent receptor domain-containing protein n=1 Tax=Dokdonella sp. TaxID=2291710 RepID=UPI0025BC7D1F|nr:TonB-dependent receptor [Dokdonella sp.]MBX3690924.1 TonB-dependent receptor [Dokdonella sp.]MCW5568300.1 TonB-dependent receptor [Dokdonella sp.]HNR91984.1 TonB-dependent receptor [Dokdonella sp.]